VTKAGRNRTLIDIVIELDFLVDMQKRNQEELDIEYLQFNISKLLELFKKRFMSKRSWRAS
jgi:Ras GTPase-activating-like protein IQGAP2/3